VKEVKNDIRSLQLYTLNDTKSLSEIAKNIHEFETEFEKRLVTKSGLYKKFIQKKTWCKKSHWTVS
jgi:hypothetical protein